MKYFKRKKFVKQLRSNRFTENIMESIDRELATSHDDYLYLTKEFLHHKKYNKFYKSTSNIENAIISLSKKNVIFPCMEEFLARIYDNNGLSSSLIAILETYIKAVKKQRFLLKKQSILTRLYHLHALRLMESGLYNNAIKSYDKISTISKNTSFKENNSIALIAHITKNYPDHKDASQDILELFTRVQNGVRIFENYIKDNQHSICIVGNSPCEINSNNGDNINKTKIVIRFNNYINDPQYYNDYGSKTDIWVKSPSYMEVNRKHDNFKIVIVGSNKNVLYDEKNSHNHFEDFLNLKQEIGYIPYQYILELKSMGLDNASIGLKTVFWIYKLIGPLDKNQIYGFKLDDQKSGNSNSDFDCNWKIKKDNYPHNWEKEKEILNSLIK